MKKQLASCGNIYEWLLVILVRNKEKKCAYFDIVLFDHWKALSDMLVWKACYTHIQKNAELLLEHDMFGV